MNLSHPAGAAHRHLIPLLRARVASTPHTELLRCCGRALSAEELLDEGARYAAAFGRAGLREGDRVAMQCGNRHEFIAVVVACALSGIVLVPINTASRGSQLAYYVRNSRARLLLCESALLPNVESANLADAEAIAALQAIWSFDPPPAIAELPRLTSVPLADGAGPVHDVAPEPTLPSLVMYTSGTSGPSKGVVCSHAQLYWWGHHSVRNIGVLPSDVLYTCLPLFHINALNTFFQALISGARVVVGLRFSVSQLFGELAKSGATVTFLLGAMVPMLLSRKPDASERAHCVRVALAPGASAQHYEEFEGRTNIRMLDGFGSTESNFVICSSLEDRRPGWMGKVAAGFEARVVDELDNEVPHGTPGELVLRHDEPFAFASGYLDMPEKTVEAWRNLWFHTGDRVLRDEDGFFRFIDRIKDSIRRRGENISSYEVEQVIGAHPCVAEVAVYAVPSELAEDEVMCSLVLREGSTYKPLELVEWCEARLAYFAIPRFWRTMAELPKTENGKIQKYKLRAEGPTPDSWELAASGYKVKR
ncbi:MAG: acid--CoA ligase [Variovorax paradoxus]|uniref:Acid--CoA ligase n=1 Tax=Variovorax paradoxus TaxID=34073 RepID=A0A2W5QJF2_VARPD|nr:MAG: acid--CoA ligase [Variovorax paradoxus]